MFKADGRNKRKVAELADAGQDLARSHPFDKKGYEDVGFFVSSECCHHIHILDVLILKQALVGPISMQDNDFVKMFCQFVAAIWIFFNKLGMCGESFKCLGQLEAKVAASYKEDVLKGFSPLSEDLQCGLEFFFF